MADDAPVILTPPDAAAAVRRTIANAMTMRSAPPDAREWLVTLRHNDDLCPRLKGKLDQLLAAHDRESHVVYDIQSPRDEGVDVIVRVTDEESDRPTYLGFQVKSEDDFRRGGVLSILKDQYFAAGSAYRSVERYYILLAADQRKHQQVIREIAREFVKKSDVRVVEPPQVAAFLRLNAAGCTSVATQGARTGDPLVVEAQAILRPLTPTQAATLVVLVDRQLRGVSTEVKDLLAAPILRRLHRNVPDIDPELFDVVDATFADFLDTVYVAPNDEPGPGERALNLTLRWEDDEEDFFVASARLEERRRDSEPLSRLAADLDALGDYVADSGGTHVLELASVMPLVAFLAAARVRFDHDEEELVEYAFRGLDSVLQRDL